ncbi:MAG: AAA family ATPase [Thiotrichales bacterium]
MPDASIAYIDEVFKANSAILNALLTLLNEPAPPARTHGRVPGRAAADGKRPSLLNLREI